MALCLAAWLTPGFVFSTLLLTSYGQCQMTGAVKNGSRLKVRSPVWEAKFIFRLPPLPPCVSAAQEECWTYGCSPSGNSHGTLIICEWKELWSRMVWMNVCIWGVFALSFAPFFHFSLSFHCHFPSSDTVWPEWAKMRAKWNCQGKWLPCPSGSWYSSHAYGLVSLTHDKHHAQI